MLINYNSTTLTAIRDSNGKIDVEATMNQARLATIELVRQDEEYTDRLGKAAIEAWESPHFRSFKSIGLSALVRMALNSLNIIPDEKNYRDALMRIRSVIATSSDKFLMLKTGNNSNVYYIPRHSQEELNKVLSGKR